jgi:hypothetical protein
MKRRDEALEHFDLVRRLNPAFHCVRDVLILVSLCHVASCQAVEWAVAASESRVTAKVVVSDGVVSTLICIDSCTLHSFVVLC